MISMLKYIYINYILCHHDRETDILEFSNFKKCTDRHVDVSKDWNRDKQSQNINVINAYYMHFLIMTLWSILLGSLAPRNI